MERYLLNTLCISEVGTLWKNITYHRIVGYWFACISGKTIFEIGSGWFHCPDCLDDE
jgi:hypothetical protein